MNSHAESGAASTETGARREGRVPLRVWVERAIVAWLFVLALSAPHSIAATQIAWGVGMLLWVLRLTLRPRPKTYRTPLDYALLGFFILTGLSAFLSYEPFVSIGKLRAASLFTIVYLVAENVPSRRTLRALALTLIASCTINVVYTLVQRVIGRGVKLENLSKASPLYLAGVREGNTVLEVDGQSVRSPEALVQALTASSANAAVPLPSATAQLKVYGSEIYWNFQMPRGSLLEGKTALERLGVGSWSRGRDWRAAGFYGHYVTYAESLQLIASLALGILIVLPRKRSWPGILLLLATVGFGLALIWTVTRASWLALLISACLMVLIGASRRTLLLIMLSLLLLVPAGLYLLQQKRNVGFFDQKDESIKWRQTVWREGARLLVSKSRHLLVGVGMDSLKAHWREWGLFDQGRLPVGHMHSNLLQLAVERGLPALFVWLILLGIYGRVLWRLAHEHEIGGWLERGIALGALGGLAGFFVSGLVHYNWGDSEVIMIFYFIMGLCLIIERERIVHKSSVSSMARLD
ncbi:MAG TPA: O-antigen ligase family protein [Pyrinomonadaceae bacterium]|jgi:hypothetical protein